MSLEQLSKLVENGEKEISQLMAARQRGMSEHPVALFYTHERCRPERNGAVHPGRRGAASQRSRNRAIGILLLSWATLSSGSRNLIGRGSLRQ